MKITKSRLREIIKQELSELTGTAATGGTGFEDAEKDVAKAKEKIDRHIPAHPEKVSKEDQKQNYKNY